MGINMVPLTKTIAREWISKINADLEFNTNTYRLWLIVKR